MTDPQHPLQTGDRVRVRQDMRSKYPDVKDRIGVVDYVTPDGMFIRIRWDIGDTSDPARFFERVVDCEDTITGKN